MLMPSPLAPYYASSLNRVGNPICCWWHLRGRCGNRAAISSRRPGGGKDADPKGERSSFPAGESGGLSMPCIASGVGRRAELGDH